MHPENLIALSLTIFYMIGFVNFAVYMRECNAGYYRATIRHPLAAYTLTAIAWLPVFIALLLWRIAEVLPHFLLQRRDEDWKQERDAG